MDVADAAAQKLRELLEQTGETVQLGIIDHDSVLYVYEMESRRAIRMAAGGRRPRAAALHRGRQGTARRAAGRVRVRQVLDLGLKAYTPKTIVKQEELLETTRGSGAAPTMRPMTRRARRGCARSPARCATTRFRDRGGGPGGPGAAQ